jgi:hypothetical protein
MNPADDRLQSLGDLMELMLEGWRVERMHYTDRSRASGPPAAYFDLSRGLGERLRVYVPDDGRALSHHALVDLFRESPHVWKHRSPEMIPPPDGPQGEEWGEVPDNFPHCSGFRPGTLQRVVAVNQVQSVDDLHIALTSLECHEGCARLRYIAHASDPGTRRQMTVLDVLVVDELGRRYRVDPDEGVAEGNHLSGALAIAPAIPADVGQITVTIGTVADGDRSGLRALGPWVFPIALHLPG